MYKVRIRFDKVEEPKAIRVEGYTKQYPEEGVEFSIYLFKDDAKIFVDLGKIIHIKPYGDMLLVQTEYTVAEVWILDNREQARANVIPLKPNTLLRIGDRVTGRREKGSFMRKSNLKTLLEYAKVDRPAPPKLKLIQEN